MTHDQSRVRITGPLEPFGDGFAEELARRGYTPKSAAMLLRLMAHLSRWMVDEALDSHKLSPSQVERFVDARRAAGYTNHLTSKALQPMLVYLRGLRVVPPPPDVPPLDGPVDVMIERFRLYLRVERGLVPEAARGYVDAVRPFLWGRLSSDGLELAHLSAADVTAFMVDRCPRLSLKQAKLTATAMRSLLGFLHLEGAIERPLATAVPSVAGWRLAGLPKALELDQVRRLLSSCDRDTANGRRDFAILTMLVRLGLRAGEVAGLGLDDIDWRAGETVIRGKGRRTEQVPLPADVGEAVAAYLRNGRPPTAEGRSVFVRFKAPHRALSAGGVSQVVAAAGLRAGLGRIHAHRLRHTAATEMLRAGAPLSEIGQLLRHRRLLTTAIYAKVDREALRTIARPWPGGEA